MNEETMNNLLDHFKAHGINKDSSKKEFQHVLDFQDCIGHSTIANISKYYKSLDQRRREHFLWSCFTCLAMDTAIGILRDVVLSDLFIQEQQRVWKEVEEERNDLAEKARGIDEIKTQNAVMTEQLDRAKEKIDQQHERIIDLEEKARRYDTIKRLLMAA